MKTPRLPTVDEDPSDDKFIKCAVKLKGNFIITGDKGLKKIGKYQNIQILSPHEFLKAFEKNKL